MAVGEGVEVGGASVGEGGGGVVKVRVGVLVESAGRVRPPVKGVTSRQAAEEINKIIAGNNKSSMRRFISPPENQREFMQY